MEKAAPEPEDDEPETGPDPARATAQAAAASSAGAAAIETARPGAQISGKRALVQYDYEKAEDNEIELKEGEYVHNIEMVDDDWWMGENVHGETGLFPSRFSKANPRKTKLNSITQVIMLSLSMARRSRLPALWRNLRIRASQRQP